MTIPSGQDPLTPYAGFNFHVEIKLDLFEKISKSEYIDDSGKPQPAESSVITGGFSEVSGLEASMEPKMIRSGGENYHVHQRAGTVSFATVILKRGLVSSRHLWGWWSLFAGADDALNGGWTFENRADVSVFLIRPTPGGAKDSSSAREALAGWTLRQAMPVKFRIGDLNASGDEIAVEELHLAHEGLHLEQAS